MRLRTSLAAALLAAAASMAPVQAMDIAPGDYAVAPSGTAMMLYYGQYTSARSLHLDEGGAVADSSMDLQVNLLRFVRFGEIGSLPFAVQAIIPFGKFSRARIGGVEQETVDGLGDVVLAGSIYPVRAQDPLDMTVGVSVFLTLPTGEYEVDAMSIGSGTSTATLQVGVIRPLHRRLTVDLAADVTISRDHSESGVSYSQDPQAEAQAYLRYAVSPQTNVSVGYARFFGGKKYADGIYQGLRADAGQLRLFADTFISPTVHVQAMVGRDLSHNGGFAADFVGQLRVLKTF